MARRKQPKTKVPRRGLTPTLDQQAQTEVAARFGPEIEALGVLYRQALGQQQSRIQNARVAGQAIEASAKAAVPGVQAMHQRVLEGNRGLQESVASRVGALPTANAYRQAVASEAPIAAQNLGLSAEAAQSLLSQMGVRARAGAAYQQGLANRDFARDVSEIQGRQASIAQQAGTFGAKTLNDLFRQQQDRNLEVAKINADAEQFQQGQANDFLIAGVDPTTGRYLPGRKPSRSSRPAPGTPGAASQEGINAFRNDFRKALGLVKHAVPSIRAGQRDPAKIIQALTVGAPAVPGRKVYRQATDENGNPVFETKRGKKVPKMIADTVGGAPAEAGIGNELAVRVATEVALHGGVRSATAKELHSQGFRLVDLGLRTVPEKQVKANIKKRREAKMIGDAVSGIRKIL